MTYLDVWRSGTFPEKQQVSKCPTDCKHGPHTPQLYQILEKDLFRRFTLTVIITLVSKNLQCELYFDCRYPSSSICLATLCHHLKLQLLVVRKYNSEGESHTS